MRQILAFEFKRAFHGRLFKISVLLGAILVIGQLIAYYYLHKFNMEFMENGLLEDGSYALGILPDTLYESFLGGESYTFFPELYFSLLPILAALPFGASFYEDTKRGYSKYIISRTGKSRYLCGKVIVAIVVGGIAGVLPYVVSMLASSAIYPAYYPNALAMHALVQENTIFSGIYYVHPMVYAMVYAVLIFAVSGLLSFFAVISEGAASNIFVVLFIPYIAYTLQDVLFTKLGLTKWSLKAMIYPANNADQMTDISAWNIVAFLGCLYILLGGLFIWRTKWIDSMTQ